MRYIDGDALFEQLCRTFERPEAPKIETSAALVISVIIQNYPAADVAPVKRGKWISMKRPNGSFEDVFKCSECEYVCRPDCHWAFCPRCGAKMDADFTAEE